METSPATFSVAQVGFVPFGDYYWTRQSPNPEPIHSHGPYLFACFAARAARKALGADARQVAE